MSNLIDKLNHYIESEDADADLYFSEFPPEAFKEILLKLDSVRQICDSTGSTLEGLVRSIADIEAVVGCERPIEKNRDDRPCVVHHICDCQAAKLRRAQDAYDDAMAALKQVESEHEALILDHERAMEGRNAEMNARLEAESRLDAALELIREAKGDSINSGGSWGDWSDRAERLMGDNHRDVETRETIPGTDENWDEGGPLGKDERYARVSERPVNMLPCSICGKPQDVTGHPNAVSVKCSECCASERQMDKDEQTTEVTRSAETPTGQGEHS